VTGVSGDWDRDENTAASDFGSEYDGADVVVYDDETPVNRRHVTYRLMTPRRARRRPPSRPAATQTTTSEENAMATFIYREDSGYDEQFQAATDEAAEERARELLRTGDYGQAQAEKTFTVRAQVARLETGDDGQEYERDSRTVSWMFEPAVPPCVPADAAHDWKEESVQGSGGGVLVRESCATCGTVRVTDTWDHDPATGDTMETVTYEHATAARLRP
jgi:hypothetical protein